LELSAQQIPFVILSGLTGSGKTHVLKKTNYYVDLEGQANHRGSAFGSDPHDFQPTQINWENNLSIDWQTIKQKSTKFFFGKFLKFLLI
jgi:tRNA 2-selenouridine synthase